MDLCTELFCMVTAQRPAEFVWVLMALFVLMQIRTIAIIAEGIPEALTRKLIKAADKKGVTIIGPATVRADDLPPLVYPVLIFTSFSPEG